MKEIRVLTARTMKLYLKNPLSILFSFVGWNITKSVSFLFTGCSLPMGSLLPQIQGGHHHEQTKLEKRFLYFMDRTGYVCSHKFHFANGFNLKLLFLLVCLLAELFLAFGEGLKTGELVFRSPFCLWGYPSLFPVCCPQMAFGYLYS